MSTLTNIKNKIKSTILNNLYIPTYKADYNSQFLLTPYLQNIYLLSTDRHLIDAKKREK